MKNNYISQHKHFREKEAMALFYIFANLYNVRLNRKQLGFHTCFCLQDL